jgi:hypothetical protein
MGMKMKQSVVGTQATFRNVQPARTLLENARSSLKHDHRQGLEDLNQLFHAGVVPKPSLNGRYAGELVALDLAPGLTQFFQALANHWMPWLGKTFNSSRQTGDNLFTKASYILARVFNPFYRGFVFDRPNTYRGFAFRTYVAPGLFDSDLSVLKIDYDLKENPSLTVRRVLDDNLYLGKAHVRWWWRPSGSWQTVAYFTLSSELVSRKEFGLIY